MKFWILLAGLTAHASLIFAENVQEVNTAGALSGGVFTRAWQGGPIAFLTLLILLLMSVATWGLVVYKWLQMRTREKDNEAFVKSFWESRSINELNGRVNEFPYSPAREVFRTGYTELVRGSQLKEANIPLDLAISASLDNLSRSLTKARNIERRKLEKFFTVLAISASACPFIGLFGTVWGIMGSFEGIAQSGSSSLAAVAPGISEALTATAFGLAAAIPAVVGYNICASKLKGVMVSLENFSADFMNIVERYLVTEKQPGAIKGTHS